MYVYSTTYSDDGGSGSIGGITLEIIAVLIRRTDYIYDVMPARFRLQPTKTGRDAERNETYVVVYIRFRCAFPDRMGTA